MDATSNANMPSGQFTATLKGKINGLEEVIKSLTDELNFYKKEIHNLRSEKNALDDDLTRKC